jgi:hypothetical protein
VRCRAFLAAAGGKAQPRDHRRRQFESMLKVATRPTGGCGETGTAFADICIRYRFADNSVDSIFACACCTTLVIRSTGWRYCGISARYPRQRDYFAVGGWQFQGLETQACWKTS